MDCCDESQKTSSTHFTNLQENQLFGKKAQDDDVSSNIADNDLDDEIDMVDLQQ